MWLNGILLVADDFSETTRASSRVACSPAREGKARFVALHVEGSQYVATWPVYPGQQSVEFSIVERDSTYSEASRERLRKESVPVEPPEVDDCIRVGAVREEIPGAAEEVGADLIAVGTHGRTGLRGLLDASVAEDVLRRADCPVVTVRAALPARKVPSIDLRCPLGPGN